VRRPPGAGRGKGDPDTGKGNPFALPITCARVILNPHVLDRSTQPDAGLDPRAEVMPNADAARDLLFGLLALQTGLIDQAKLVASFHAWTLDRSRPLADHLVGLGHLDAAQRAAIEALTALHVEKHGGDPETSLAALGAGRSTRERLAGLGDPEVNATLARVGPGSAEPEDRSGQTLSMAVGTATADGQRFRVLRPHARGGLGAVFVALDSELNREVALKEILDGHADDPVSRQRFLMEAEITGRLEHPGIVPVYGLGTYGGGRPYYAMRFIQGDSLKEAVARFHAGGSFTSDTGRRSLELRKLLRRFLDVCNAIEFAHTRGVLHRDIKPGNVMVGRHGETLVVDWGLAKPVGKADLDPASGARAVTSGTASAGTETLPGMAIGTPSFMSPEQAAGDLDRLGPRSDVYSLGATLYCLLTGRPPFEGSDVGGVLRAVQGGAFRPPRQVDPSVDRALEAVCLKAMALRPEDRYGSARALAEDVERWTADEPVFAWREPLGRRARRWARRNRTAVAGAAVAGLAGLIGLAAVAVLQARHNAELTKANDATRRALAETTKAQRATEAALADTRAAKKATEAALAESEGSRRLAESALAFLKRDVLAAARPAGQAGGLGRGATVREAVDAAEPRIAGAFQGQPAVEAEVRDTLGGTYYYLGEVARAIRQYERALELRRGSLGPDHPDTLTSRNNLAAAYLAAGRSTDAIGMHEEALRLYAARLGPDHPDTLTSRNNLAEAYTHSGRPADAARLHEEALRLYTARLGPDHPDTLRSRNNLAAAYLAAGRSGDAVRMHEEALRLYTARLGPGHPETLTSRNNLAEAYREAGKPAEAARMHAETLRLRAAALGPDHPATLSSRNNLAEAFRDLGRPADAARLHEETLGLMTARLGPDHPDTITIRSNLALAYYAAGRPADAARAHAEVLRLRTARLGPDHPATVASAHNLAAASWDSGRRADAIALWEGMLPTARRVFGPGHPNTLNPTNSLASALEALGRWAAAEPLRRELVARRREAEGPDSPVLAGDLAGLGFNLLSQAKPPEAEPVLRECLAIRAKAIPDDYRRFSALSMLGEAVLGRGRYAEAEPLVQGGYAGLKARATTIAPTGEPLVAEAAERVVRLYEAWGKPEQARAWKARLGLADLPADVFARP
jgi:tetratricopeptide (TPR) repeat protein/tRNA A-37 threonylcarbamoyl transferase component Bud32